MITLRHIRWGMLIALALASIALLSLGDALGKPLQVALSWIAIVIVVIALGNWGLHQRLNRFLTWEESPGRRFSWQLVLGMLYSLVCINLTYLLFKGLFLQVLPDSAQMLLLNLYGLFFLLPVISVHGVLYLMTQWRRSIVYSETLKQQQVRSELESLKNHLDPHFLFNNLNILSSLIDQNPAAAQDFLGNFSEVYRYVLRQREEELVSLRSELEFLDAYVYMLRQRFGENMQIEIDIEAAHRHLYVPPLALQMLIENAIKHNKATDSSPLQISIRSEKKGLMICNNLQKKIVAEASTGFGLESIVKRYGLLSDKKVLIREDKGEFKVSIPIMSNNEI